MLTLVERIIFLFLAIGSLYLAQKFFRQAAQSIARGEGRLAFDQMPRRLWKALDVTFTQRTVFRARPVASLMHGFIVWGFLFYFLVNIGDLLEGYLDINFMGMGAVGNAYRLIGDILSVMIIIGMVYFLVRRFLVRTPALTFHDNVKLHPKVQAGIRRDSLIVGLFILIHVGGRFLGETFWIALRDGDSWQPIANAVASLWSSMDHSTLEVAEHAMWWLALGTILAFVPYFPFTKHMHLFMGPLNYLSRPERTSLGALDPVDFEDEKREQFGAARLEHLSRTQIFDAFACIMCNRCQDVCPAYVTGKELSPSALEVNKRYEIRTIMPTFAAGQESPTPLSKFAITLPAVWACTTCGACIEICPVGNEPMFDIIDIRRDQVLVQGEFPDALQGAFRGMENNSNPWQIGESRMGWAAGLNVPTIENKPEFDILYWVGCAGSYDPGAQRVARAMVRILQAAEVKFAVLGEMENCTGDSARRAGNEYLFYELAKASIESLNEAGVTRIVATCPHCFHTLGNEYPQFGGHYEVIHHTEFINELIQTGRLKANRVETANVTFHDPCYLGRHNGIYDAPRVALGSLGIAITEMPRTRNSSFCCGAGGAQFWKEEEHGSARVNLTRYVEAAATGADAVAVGCPFCLRMLSDAGQDQSTPDGLMVKDVAEIIAERLGLNY